MDNITGAKDMMVNHIEPLLKKHLQSYVVTGEYRSIPGGMLRIHSTHRPSLTAMYRPERLTEEFGEHLLQNGVMRKNWDCYCTEDNHPVLAQIKKLDPLLKEVMERYTILARAHDCNALVVKSGCDGFYALHLLVHGYYARNQPTAS